MTKEIKVMAVIAAVLIIGGVLLIINQKPDGNNNEIADQKLLVGEQTFHTNPAGAAKVTVVEFGDYQCPACANAEPVIRRIITAQSTNPNFDFVYRHLPLPQHANALISAEAAEAARAQGKFLEMHALLYEKQNDWAGQKDPMPAFEGYARDLGLDVDKFKASINSRQAEGFILQGARDGENAGVDSTPTFFINGKKFPGVPGKDFTDYLQNELNK